MENSPPAIVGVCSGATVLFLVRSLSLFGIVTLQIFFSQIKLHPQSVCAIRSYHLYPSFQSKPPHSSLFANTYSSVLSLIMSITGIETTRRFTVIADSNGSSQPSVMEIKKYFQFSCFRIYRNFFWPVHSMWASKKVKISPLKDMKRKKC